MKKKEIGSDSVNDKISYGNIYRLAINSREVEENVNETEDMFMSYNAAIKEVRTKLEILNDEFQIKSKRNPIEYIKSRTKSSKSLFSKLERRGFPMSIESAKKNIFDIAGVRVICSFVDDIYLIADLLTNQNDVTLIEKKDYIKTPKPNGYRSLHLVVGVPIYFSDGVELVNVEVQIRTMAMDFWASLEHKLYYKTAGDVPTYISYDLKECADIIASTDIKMQQIHDLVEKLEESKDN